MSRRRSSGPSYRGKEIFRSSVISDFHRLPHKPHRFGGRSFRFYRTLRKNSRHVTLALLEFLPPFVDRAQLFLQAVKQPHFALDAAYSRRATTLVHLGNPIL